MKIYENDMVLWQQLKERDPDAFAFIYTTYRKWLMVVAYGIVQNETEAQDLVQKFFEDLWQMDWKNSSDLTGPIRNFLFISIRNRSLNQVRANEIQRKRYAQVQLPETFEPPANILENKELQQQLSHAMSLLPAVRAKVFKLGYLYHYSRQQIAHQLGISEATVKNHMALALKDLRNLLKNNVH
ncbi:RNA polymerase sigma factor [Chitinophaga qingshengii]|uniref:Sigma-70 family RNA polymerase sigma factor n=1 Tax=Chitinophaga qingshengii TaxID=1569794 RepID=A0ABR7THW4_9BACT|nr:sigma-70 family RNA polymerase sigma factor [Chitinophaga qingshengii]MBC9929096.1 sigma-70 family RNA polymerase sigma factor [Chitinophaga qingshengii]